MLEELSQDRSSQVRTCIALHPNTSLKLLKELAKDNVYSVKMLALKRIKEYEQI